MRFDKDIFLYFLADAAGLTYDWIDGRPVKSNQPTWIESPAGWMDGGISFARNSTYYGINRAWSGDLKFTRKAASIIRSLFYSGRGVEQDLFFLVLQLNEATGIYELIYRGEVDLTTFQDLVWEGVQVSIMEGGVIKLLKAFEGTVFQIPLDGSIPENIRINLDGYRFNDVFTYQINSLDDVQSGAALSCAFLSNTGDNIGIEKGTQSFEELDGSTTFADYVPTSTNYFYSSIAPVSLRLKGQISVTATHGHSNVLVSFITSKNRQIDIIPISTFINDNQVYVQPFDITIDLAADEHLFLMFFGQVTASKFHVDTSQFTVTFSSQFKSTQTWAIKARDVLTLLVKMAFGRLYPVSSELLDSLPNYALTSGDALRDWAIPDNLKQPVFLKTCIKDFFDWINSLEMAALGNEYVSGVDTLFIERREKVYDASVITLDVGEVSDLKLESANSYLDSEVDIGWPNQNYDQTSGKLEFNTTHSYKLPFTKVNKKASLVPKYRADMMGIEFTRFNSTGGASITNNSSDPSVFVLDIDAGSPLPLQYRAQKQTPRNYGVTSDIDFETFAGTQFTANAAGTLFTYSGGTQDVRLSIEVSTPNGQVQTLNAYKNGTLLQSVTIGTSGFGSGGMQIDTTLSTGDTLRFELSGTGVFTLTAAFLVINFKSLPVYNLFRDTYDSITGIDNPDSAFNLRLSPKRMMLKWGKWWRSLCYNQVDQLITFQTSDKNQQLVTVQNGVTVREAANVSVASLPLPMLYPILVSFKTRVPINFPGLLTGAKNGHIRATYNGVPIYLFPEEVKQVPALNPAQEWKGLLSPATDVAALADLDIDGLNFLNLIGMPLIFPHLNPAKVVSVNQILPGQYHFMHMDQWWFIEQVQFYTSKKNYFQKWQQNDVVSIQCFTNGLGPVKVDILNAQGKIVKTITELPVTSDPSVRTPMIMYQGSVVLNDLAEGVYYPLFTAGTGGTIAQGLGEGWHVKADWPRTMLFEFTNSVNRQGMVFSAGFVGRIRVEAWLDQFTPDANISAYEDQPADMAILNGVPFRKYILNIGDGPGTPPWMIDKINRIMLLDNVTVDGIGIARNGADAKFERVDVPGWPMAFYTLEVRESENSDTVAIPSTNGGVLDDNLTVEYNINTKGFGDGSNGDNIVEVTKIS